MGPGAAEQGLFSVARSAAAAVAQQKVLHIDVGQRFRAVFVASVVHQAVAELADPT